MENIRVNFLLGVNNIVNGIVSREEEKVDFVLADGILYFAKGPESPMTKELISALKNENYQVLRMA